jgi:hypothetical protein
MVLSLTALLLAFSILGGCMGFASGFAASMNYVSYGDEEPAALAHGVNVGLVIGFVYGAPYGIAAWYLVTTGAIQP